MPSDPPVSALPLAGGELEKEAAARRESETRFQEMVEDLNDVLFELDVEGRFLYVSKAVITITGRTPEQLLGTSFLDLVAPADRERSAEIIKRRAAGEKFPPAEYRFVALDGSVRWARSLSRPILRDGHSVGLRGVASDITDVKVAEEQLRLAREQLLQSQKMEAVGRLAGGIAHDFNNLLTLIQGYGELVEHELRERGGDVELAREILRTAARAAELTRQMLAFGRRQVLHPAPIDLNREVDRIEGVLRRMIGEDVEIAVRLAPELVPVFVDPAQIEQILLDLAVNARDAMPGGGRLTLSTAEQELGADEANEVGLPPGRYVELRVADTGCGIPAEIRHLIFEPFFTTKEVGKGTGLGLSTVYGIVRQSGGGIAVASHVGRGTVFSIYLPPAGAPGGGEAPEVAVSR